MDGIGAVNNVSHRNISQEQKDKTQKTATVVGSTGFVATSATRYAGKRGLLGGESALQKMMKATTEAAKITGEGVKQSSGFIARFKQNTKLFTQDVLKLAQKLQNNKILGPIVKSPIMKGIAGTFGVVTAFFVLLSEGSKAAENGTLAVGDLKDKIDQMRMIG